MVKKKENKREKKGFFFQVKIDIIKSLHPPSTGQGVERVSVIIIVFIVQKGDNGNAQVI